MQLSKNKVCLLPTGFSLHKARGTWRLQPVEWHLLKRQLLTHILFAQLKRVCLCASKVDNVCVCVCDVNRLVNCVGINSANWLARRRCSYSSLIATQSSPLIYASCLTSKWAKKKRKAKQVLCAGGKLGKLRRAESVPQKAIRGSIRNARLGLLSLSCEMPCHDSCPLLLAMQIFADASDTYSYGQNSSSGRV